MSVVYILVDVDDVLVWVREIDDGSRRFREVGLGRVLGGVGVLHVVREAVRVEGAERMGFVLQRESKQHEGTPLARSLDISLHTVKEREQPLPGLVLGLVKTFCLRGGLLVQVRVEFVDGHLEERHRLDVGKFRLADVVRDVKDSRLGIDPGREALDVVVTPHDRQDGPIVIVTLGVQPFSIEHTVLEFGSQDDWLRVIEAAIFRAGLETTGVAAVSLVTLGEPSYVNLSCMLYLRLVDGGLRLVVVGGAFTFSPVWPFFIVVVGV